MSIIRRRILLLLFAVGGLSIAGASGAVPEILDSGLKPGDVERRPYREYVRECVEVLIEHGTDRYGKVHSPMLMNILDVRTRECPQDPLPLDEAWRVERRGRRGPAGGNLYPDQPAYKAMLALSRITGDGRYAAFAARSMDYTMTNLVDPQGFFWWGWHRHYDAYRDEMTGHLGNPHEIHVQQAIWPDLWKVNRAAVTREIEAIWQWHVVDKKTGEVNRHGDGQRGCDFAMSAGEILCSFAFLYGKTHDAKWLERARLVAGRYWAARDPKTQLIPNQPNAGRARFDGAHFDTSITGLYCHLLLAAFEYTGDRMFRDQAVTYLKAYAKYGYDETAGKFWGSLGLDGQAVSGPRVTGGYAQYQARGHIDLWQPADYSGGYECPIATAQCYAWACLITRDEELLKTAKRWAEWIRREFPPRTCQRDTWYREYAEHWAPHGAYASQYGGTISFLLSMRQATGDDAYLGFAREVAREAVSRLYYRGLFRGHPVKPYYESMDGVGCLLYALLQLDQALAGRGSKDIALDNW